MWMCVFSVNWTCEDHVTVGTCAVVGTRLSVQAGIRNQAWLASRLCDKVQVCNGTTNVSVLTVLFYLVRGCH